MTLFRHRQTYFSCEFPDPTNNASPDISSCQRSVDIPRNTHHSHWSRNSAAVENACPPHCTITT